MTREQARREANRRWGTSGSAIGDRYGTVSLKTKKHRDRCVVGYHVRKGNGLVDICHMGSGPTWEEAFAEADRNVLRNPPAAKE